MSSLVKHYFSMSVTIVILMTFSSVHAETDKSTNQDRPKIEVAFILDTTGSMEGLIEGAKAKIWSIANDIVNTDPTPDLKIGLIGYRDKTDKYVTRVNDLSDDIDAMYEHLQAFSAQGGGDRPESVNQALYEAVTKLNWSKSPEILKIIFLVGDAPPHMDYANEIQYPEICQMAVKKDLIINTIQCGDGADTLPVWQKIARLSEGKYVQIGQSGGMVAVETPMDDELESLNRQLAQTAIAYGREEERMRVTSKMSRSFSAPKAAIADRLDYLSKSKKVVTGEGDLVEDTASGSVKLEEVDSDALPDKMRGMSTKEQKAYIEKKAEQRKQIQSQIDDLLKQRTEYLKKQAAENRKKDAFDEKVADMIRQQAASKGILYK